MRNWNGILLTIAALGLGAPRTGTAIDICSDFDDGTLQGWTTSAALANIGVQGPTLSPADLYLHGGDLPSGPVSTINAPAPYLGDLNATLGLEMTDACLEFDYIVWEEGFPGVTPVCPHVTLKDDPDDFAGTRFVFYCAPGIRVTEPAGTNPGWHRYKIPIRRMPTLGTALPGNAMGDWVLSSPPIGNIDDQWNNLLANVNRLYFLGDIAASPSQTESYGIDNVCLRSACTQEPDDPFVTDGGPLPDTPPEPFVYPTANRETCAVAKKKCVSKKVTGLLKCHEKAERTGKPVDPACETKVRARFDGSLLVPPDPSAGCFEQAEARYGAECITTDDTAATEAEIDAFVVALVTALDPGYPTPIRNGCSARKKKCAAKKAEGLLKCHAAAEKKGTSLATERNQACFAKVRAKFDLCFEKSELAVPCLTTGDTGAIEDLIDAFVDSVVCDLHPTGGTCPEPGP